MSKAALLGKSLLFPGLDLNTRCRYRFLAALIQEGDLETLDAGFGNGALSYAAYRKGNRVLGVTLGQREVDATRALFDRWGIPRSRLDLQCLNIYDLGSLHRTFDQIICSETLEHLTRDAEVIHMFSRLLNPGGRLVLCCPHAVHPAHALGRTNEPENGGHVRDGYTLDSYKVLLESAGLRITGSLGLGSPLLLRLDTVLRQLRNGAGDLWALPLFCLFLPFTWLDYANPELPFSLAVVAEKA
jgi:SAM-dependent methyltransferase